MTQFTKAGFARSYVVPALLLFALPLVGYVFSHYAIDAWDAQFLAGMNQAVERLPNRSAEQRRERLEFYLANPASQLCATGAAGGEVRTEVCRDYAQLAWIEKVSLASLALGALSVLVVVGCAWVAFASRPAQYWSFVAGWNFLRAASAFQVVAQGFLAVLLSFWLTAFFFELYVIKLVAVAGVMALCAVVLVLKAIFAKPNDRLAVEGEPLSRARSPKLWARVEALCARVGTPPPDHIVGGIDDNFFVTEHPVYIGDSALRGRTLFVSLSLLKRLDKAEADAVLAHEMAHFNGGDTEFSKRVAPMLARYETYLGALHQGAMSRPIFHFMLFYRSLLELSLGRHSRSRELRADEIAAQITAPQLLGSALLKVAAYSSYRNRVEQGLFAGNRAHAELDIAQRVAVGFTTYTRSHGLGEDLASQAFPHPFDTHPPLGKRLAALGVELAQQELPERVIALSADTWFAEIGDAERIEAALWAAYEARFRAAHEESLAYRYLPATPEERAHVERFFPPRSLAAKKGAAVLELDCEQLRHADWPRAVGWGEIERIKAEDEPFRGKVLTFHLAKGGEGPRKLKFRVDKLADPADAVIELVGQYYGRYSVAQANLPNGATAPS